jgi:hypothetical protein
MKGNDFYNLQIGTERRLLNADERDCQCVEVIIRTEVEVGSLVAFQNVMNASFGRLILLLFSRLDSRLKFEIPKVLPSGSYIF